MIAMSISEGRKKLFEIRKSVVEDCETAILTHKDGNMVLVSQEEWDNWQETLRFYRDNRAVKALESSIERWEQGEESGKQIDQVFIEETEHA